MPKRFWLGFGFLALVLSPVPTGDDFGVGFGTARRGPAAVALEESRTPSGAGFEQAWRFDAAPRGAGDLEVRVQVSRTFLSADPTGLHFQGMRYGHATWVDARGQRTPLESRFEDGSIRLVVSEALLARSSYPAVLDPIVGPELSFGPTALVPTQDSFTGGVLAFNGVDYVIYWNEARRTAHPNAYAAGITLDGGIAPGVEISPRDVTPTAAEFDGQDLVVAFNDGPGITIARASSAALQPGPATAVTNGRNAHLARMDSGLLMVHGESALSTLVIEADGGISAADGGALVPNTTRTCCASSDVDVAFNGVAANLVVWVDGRNDVGDIYGRLTDVQGAPTSAPFVISASPGEQRRAEVSGGGGVFLVTWEDDSNTSVWYSLVSATGVVQQPQRLGNIASSNRRVTSTFDGTNFIVVWTQSDAERLRAARVSTAGLMLEPGVRVDGSCFPEGPLEITSDGRGHSLVGYWGNILTLQARRLTGAQPDDAAPLYFNFTAQSQYQASMASDDTGHTLLGWSASRFGLDGVFLNVDGGVPMPVKFTLSVDGRDGVNVATNGSAFWAAWSSGGNMVGRFLSPDGGLGPETAVSTGVTGTSGVASSRDRDGFLTIWSDRRVTPGGVFARRSFVDGGFGPEFEVSPGGPAEKIRPAVAVNDAGVALILWGYTSGQLQAVRVSGEQTLDVPPLNLRADKYFSNPSVSSDGRDFLVAWEHGPSGGALLAAFVPGSGSWDGGDFFLDGPPSSARGPHVRWDGRRYLVAFETQAVDPRTDVWMLAVDSDGGKEPPIPVAAGVDTEAYGVSSSPAPGTLWLAWSAFDPALQSMRVHARLISPDPVDAGPLDGGAVDGGAVDGGSVDGGSVDAGSLEPTQRTFAVGCSCGSVEPLMLGLGALLLSGTRRRRS
ncbi:MAG: hypothetical protein Q8N23_14980 [Archangium sp.]|nr:hypothetical protein [Archangium sp.]MDP3574250.1 hypothetical protein [Archangium sp.]